MKNVKIGGVPEHFNLAWYLTLKNGEYKDEGINLRWKDYYGGTGSMCKALRNGDIDMAVILTEGIVKDIVEGNPSKIVQVFVQSPLIWGIHVANDSKYTSINDLKGTKAAISRYGSGSHLMAYINAQNNDWNLEEDLNFEVVKNLDGAVEGLVDGKADYFMWEKFTTKPIVDKGVFRRVDNCPTPWPCFVIAVRDEFIENNLEELNTILDIINNTTSDFKSIPSIDKTISNRYDQKLEDVQEWLNLTEWSQENIDKSTITNVQNKLFELNIIDKKLQYPEIVYKL
ncbi:MULTISPECIES: substrate-binding domain-containing protein [Flavobacteriaceae]|jgi:ABC-type nitrate/sulfonate/bicarbonate transport system substrate-binding protein|uniref:Substrate-binding domain-containing protein n=2 Tax=Flavobacteriaceae TaxID=49546 RepID=A0ABP3UZC2_9FLAO|nr:MULTISPECIES: substrate-binding domain-containing protein [Meridianimaribacter]RYH74503.1 ABC transporter substrate-binding protein [Flavobacteriaceae bacterium 144Ye]TBV26595.1 ABC transporter substrate-binding protein [Meridianimaribacter sp. CL38]TDY12276.1 ABC-type nitrate/sulfonate/bicarbonate transport system substrate-binding protein [Meridianimaribacter flavus]